MSTNYTKTTITLPNEILKRLKELLPKGKYSEFTAEAIKEKLAREKSWNILKVKGILRFSKNEPFFKSKKFFAKIDKLEAKKLTRLRKKYNG